MFVVHLSSCAETSPALPVIYEGVNELVQDDILPETGLVFPVHGKDSVLYAASEDGDIVGVLCFNNERRVTLLYVEPSSRRQGVATALIAAFSKGGPIRSILVHSRNAPGLALAKKYKMVPYATSFTQMEDARGEQR